MNQATVRRVMPADLSSAAASHEVREGSTAAGWIAFAAGTVAFLVSRYLMMTDVPLVANWYYHFAWYSVLLIADGVVASTGATGVRGEFLLLSRPKYMMHVLGWSSVVWFFYELLNFRLLNWYYINLPPDVSARWIGSVFAFATVLPAVFLAEALLASRGFAFKVRWGRLRVTPRFLTGMQITGALMMVLVLMWPRYFFALVWGASMLIVEPTVYRRDRERSLLADLERGEPGRLLRLLAGGALIGFIWEGLNINARSKWIYTVPFFEELKLFEMPLPGFLGFPPFAVECFILWQALVTSGCAVTRQGKALVGTASRRVMSAIAATVFCAIVLAGMELFTFYSTRPALDELDAVPASTLERNGYDAFTLADAEPSDVAAQLNIETNFAEQWVEQARLVTLRGIGAENARLLNRAGINSIEDLARADSRELIPRLEELSGEDLVDARVRVWIRGARRTIEAGRVRI